MSNMAWATSELFTTSFAMNNYSAVLPMAVTARGILLSPGSIALPAAEMMFEPRYAIRLFLYGFTTVVT